MILSYADHEILRTVMSIMAYNVYHGGHTGC